MNVIAMTKTEINAACAKALGICTHPVEAHRSETIEDGNSFDTDYWCDLCKKDFIRDKFPNFFGSHDACQQLRDALTEEQRISFVTFLITSGSSHHEAYWRISNATPEQICKAFLSAKGIE